MNNFYLYLKVVELVTLGDRLNGLKGKKIVVKKVLRGRGIDIESYEVSKHWWYDIIIDIDGEKGFTVEHHYTSSSESSKEYYYSGMIMHSPNN